MTHFIVLILRRLVPLILFYRNVKNTFLQNIILLLGIVAEIRNDTTFNCGKLSSQLPLLRGTAAVVKCPSSWQPLTSGTSHKTGVTQCDISSRKTYFHSHYRRCEPVAVSTGVRFTKNCDEKSLPCWKSRECVTRTS